MRFVLASHNKGKLAELQEILGEEWLTPERFRIGASSLANNLLSAIEGNPVHYF